jgi:chromosome segregation ATPase
MVYSKNAKKNNVASSSTSTRKTRSTKATRGSVYKKKTKKCSKASFRRHCAKKNANKPQPDSITQRALEVSASLFVQREELQEDLNQMENEVGSLKEVLHQTEKRVEEVQRERDAAIFKESIASTERAKYREQREDYRAKYGHTKEKLTTAERIVASYTSKFRDQTSFLHNNDNNNNPPPTV